MSKITVRLPDEIEAALRAMARETRIDEEELFRQAVADKVTNRPRPRPRAPLYKFGFGDPTAAERVDDLLAGRGTDSGG